MKILLAVDDSRPSEEAVNEIASRTWSPDTTVRLFSAFTPYPFGTLEVWYAAGKDLEQVWDEASQGALNTLDTYLQVLQPSGLKVETAVRDGHPQLTIVEEAERWGADLIVVGSHGYRGIKRLVLGSVAHDVVSHAPCSVEVVYHPTKRKRD